jgi:hypothetical protein
VSRFTSKWENSKKIVNSSHIVMLSNKSLHKRNPTLLKMSLKELAESGTLIADIIKKAMDADYEPPSLLQKTIRRFIRL